MIKITSQQNEKIKIVNKLRQKNKRDKTNLFLIEGYREILRANEFEVKIDSIFICPEFFLGNNEDTLIEKIKKRKAQVYLCTKNVFEKISYRDRPDGLIVIAKQNKLDLDDLEKIIKKKKVHLFVILEAIEKPGNLGTILRSSDATKVDAVIVCDPCTDIYNPNVVRASIGTLFSQKVIISNSDDVIFLMKKYNIKIVATTPHTKNMYYGVDLKKSTAIVMGTEQYGLSDKWLKSADVRVKIPMLGIADSLNVAAATTIMLYETIRQKRS